VLVRFGHVADAYRDGKRFIVRVDEKLTCVSGTRIGDSRLRRIVLTGWRDFSKLGVAKPILNQAENFPR
jgi:hypothetical protein